MTKPLIDDSTLDNFSPYEAAAVLKRLTELYKDGVTPREAMELHRLEKRIRAKAAI